ncbi:MAG: CHRD domain-containing protein [Hyalangium sp.]|uniref:CHRD domain-containing protein n=1 Tax=Hyalangium sp. TaxID=2028555 RepID=UPI003899D675
MKANRLFIAGVAALSLAACGGGTDYTAAMSSSAEKPAVTVASTGTGNATVTVDKKIEVSGTFSGLTANAAQAHIHGPMGADGTGPVYCTLKVPGATSGSIEAGASDDAASCAAKEVTDAEKAYFDDGKMYVNIHTSNNPGGEIRGDLAKK